MLLHDDDHEAIAEKVAAKMALHPAACLMFTPSEATDIKTFVRRMNEAGSVALATAVGFVVLALLGALVFGVVQKIKGT
jgi:hypothetical protein